MKFKNIIILLTLFFLGLGVGFKVGWETKPIDNYLAAQLFYVGCITGVVHNKGTIYAPCQKGANVIFEAGK